MNLGIALLTLWHLWLETEGDWIPPEHGHRSFLFHPTLDTDINNSDDLDLVSVNEGDRAKVVRVTRSTEVEMAKPAECKVRPEVVEITRGMVDPTRANFYLWPSCVEVQRCSGCCNSRIYKCQPTQVQKRRVKVRKQVYRRKSSVIKMVEVVLLDHVACKCMTAAQSADSQGREDIFSDDVMLHFQGRPALRSQREIIRRPLGTTCFLCKGTNPTPLCTKDQNIDFQQMFSK
ncbi:platelet-derived growth factor subunit A-like isoform X1 [Mobula hypostoma]|uniref:platelet-derived growth factor subunit A-like isoform X1 n=1 Tax=Mobula hypostoma TaxID=723540 RepID=UPI002FC38707